VIYEASAVGTSNLCREGTSLPSTQLWSIAERIPMIGNAVRKRLHRLIAFLGVPLVAASAAVVLTATPAQAALIYEGTFTIESVYGCIEVKDSGTANRTPIQTATCNGADNQRWAIFLDTGRNVRWILAYGGQYPLNKCMDAPDSSDPVTPMHIYGCHGGHQQRFNLAATPYFPQQIQQTASHCVGVASSISPRVARVTCRNDRPGEFAPDWTLFPA